MNTDKEEVQIDLLALAKKLWDNRKFIIKCSVIGAVIGIIIALSIPKEYTTIVVLTTESSKSTGGGMGALASMARINLGGAGSEDVFSPELYPEVLKSTPFIQGLMKINVIDEEQDINTTFYNYLKEEQKVAWWSYILGAPKALTGIFSSENVNHSTTIVNNPRFISEEEMGLIAQVKASYGISTDKKSGVTTIDVTAQSPKISAFVADTLTSYLQTYIIEQRTKKAKTDLENSQKLYNQAKANYYSSQQNVASFADGNMNVISAKYRINQERLQNEASLAYSVYNQMAQQVQMNKIKVQDNTPVFTVIQPAIESLFPEKPKKKIIVIGLVFLSLATSCGWILAKDYIKQLKDNIKA